MMYLQYSEEFLKMSFNAIKYYVFYQSLSPIMAHYCHVIYTLALKVWLKTCLPRVNLRQITLLRGYIHPNDQPLVLMP